MKRFLPLVDGILPFFAALFIRATIYSMIVTVFTLSMGIRELSVDMQYYISVITMVICGLIFYFWYQKIKGYSVIIPKLLTVKGFSLLLVLGIACQLFVSGLLSILKPFFEKSFIDYGNTLEGIFTGNIYLVLFYVIILAPVTEELIFRGVMYNLLNKSLPFIGVNLMQAAAFGIYHWNLVQGVYAFFIGLLLGWIRYNFKGMLAPILLHVFINASSFFMVLVPSNNLAYLISAMSGGIITVLVAYVIKKQIQKVGVK